MTSYSLDGKVIGVGRLRYDPEKPVTTAHQFLDRIAEMTIDRDQTGPFLVTIVAQEIGSETDSRRTPRR